MNAPRVSRTLLLTVAAVVACGADSTEAKGDPNVPGALPSASDNIRMTVNGAPRGCSSLGGFIVASSSSAVPDQTQLGCIAKNSEQWGFQLMINGTKVGTYEGSKGNDKPGGASFAVVRSSPKGVVGYESKDECTIVVTAVGAVDESITGTFSCDLPLSPFSHDELAPNQLVITGSFDVLRRQ